ncbi:hypothetical protein [Streptomyces tsukubensis]|uniref:hypothetical protein n=1 Tax=Streptomyces tsukubensis TaxID=83656 RepID=UPI00344DB75E
MRWTDHLDPSDEALAALRGGVTRLADCGVHWDAVIITPLARGLAALDILGLGLDDGHMVIADRNRQELAVLVPAGSGALGGGAPQGVRLLSTGSWLLVPDMHPGSWAASWLSGPYRGETIYVEVAPLLAAVTAADAERLDGARC